MDRIRITNETVNTKKKKRKGEAKSNADDIIRSEEQWVVAAMDRERFNEKVFSSRNLAKTVSLICGASKSMLLRVRKRNSENNGNKPGRREIKLDDFDKRALSRLVLGLYRRTPPQIPMVTRIYEESQKIPGFPQIGDHKSPGL